MIMTMDFFHAFVTNENHIKIGRHSVSRPVKLDIEKDTAFIFQTSGTTGLNKGIDDDDDDEMISMCLGRIDERTYF